MSEMVMVIPVIAVTAVVGAGCIYIIRGFLKQREAISPVREAEAVEHEEILEAA